MMLPARLPNIANARLPQSYEKARFALEKCARIDECAEWAKKSEALASYAKQAKDDGLRKMADRIQARAIRRCGELLRAIEPKPGTRTDLGSAPTRGFAASTAGLSVRQRKTALRVANIPEKEFEQAIESDNPPTVTELAERGQVVTKPILDIGDRNPEEVVIATQGQGHLERLANFASAFRADSVVRGSFPKEHAEMIRHATMVIRWCTDLLSCLEES